MNREWSVIPHISTRWTISSHLKSEYINRLWHMELKTKVMTWGRSKNVARIWCYASNWLMSTKWTTISHHMFKIVGKIKTLFSFESCTLVELSYGNNLIKWRHELCKHRQTVCWLLNVACLDCSLDKVDNSFNKKRYLKISLDDFIFYYKNNIKLDRIHSNTNCYDTENKGILFFKLK